MSTAKTHIIEDIFDQRWNTQTERISNTVVTLSDVSQAIARYNTKHPSAVISTRNPANFFKDFIRVKTSANRNWPASVLQRGYTARQSTGSGNCFEFVTLASGQTTPFSLNNIPGPGPHTPQHQIASASLPLASRRLGRSDEPWLVQVLVRLRVLETHLSLFSTRNIVQVDHLQMNVKLTRTEIDALFLAIEDTGDGRYDELIVCCEAKGKRDDILEDQVLNQIRAVFSLSGVSQNIVLPVAVKAVSASKVHVIEFDAVTRSSAPTLMTLGIASEAVYEFVPKIPGIGT